MDFFPHPVSLIFFYFVVQNIVIVKVTSSNFCFFVRFFFSLACNDAVIWITHLNTTEQITKLDFYLYLQNTEIVALTASRWRTASENNSFVQVNCKYCLHKLKWTKLILRKFLKLFVGLQFTKIRSENYNSWSAK